MEKTVVAHKAGPMSKIISCAVIAFIAAITSSLAFSGVDFMARWLVCFAFIFIIHDPLYGYFMKENAAHGKEAKKN